MIEEQVLKLPPFTLTFPLTVTLAGLTEAGQEAVKKIVGGEQPSDSFKVTIHSKDEHDTVLNGLETEQLKESYRNSIKHAAWPSATVRS